MKYSSVSGASVSGAALEATSQVMSLINFFSNPSAKPEVALSLSGNIAAIFKSIAALGQVDEKDIGVLNRAIKSAEDVIAMIEKNAPTFPGRSIISDGVSVLKKHLHPDLTLN